MVDSFTRQMGPEGMIYTTKELYFLPLRDLNCIVELEESHKDNKVSPVYRLRTMKGQEKTGCVKNTSSHHLSNSEVVDLVYRHGCRGSLVGSEIRSSGKSWNYVKCTDLERWRNRVWPSDILESGCRYRTGAVKRSYIWTVQGVGRRYIEKKWPPISVGNVLRLKSTCSNTFRKYYKYPDADPHRRRSTTGSEVWLWD